LRVLYSEGYSITLQTTEERTNCKRRSNEVVNRELIKSD